MRPGKFSSLFNVAILNVDKYCCELMNFLSLRKLPMSSGNGIRQRGEKCVPASEQAWRMIATYTFCMNSALLESFESKLDKSGFQFIAHSNRDWNFIKRTIDVLYETERGANSALQSQN